MRLYNTLTKQKEEFVPIHEDEVLIYSCGPTVYNFFHIGNARPFIIFDTLRRYLEYRGKQVKFVQNFTDIDDKMIKRANEEGITIKELADRFIKEYYIDAEGLAIEKATVHPKATENIGEIIKTVKILVDKGLAYESQGDVYFDTTKFPGYGKLSGQSQEDLEAGARIDVSEIKKHPMDFALWKSAKPGEPSWKSPWGEGRPGWHIECTAMANKYLGHTIDIHCGGQDLIFPHHENEIAQSEGANGCEFAHYWLHNGYINVDNQKMSKSLNNFFTVRDAAKEFGYEAIRFFMLSAHYRSPINYSAEILTQAQAALGRLYSCRDNLLFLQKSAQPGEAGDDFKEKLLKHKAGFIEQMDDDINTSGAIGCIFELVTDINTLANGETALNAGELQFAYDLLKELTGVLRIMTEEPKEEFPAEVLTLIEKRQEARKQKDFKTADEIRDQLAAMGYGIEDTKNGAKPVKL